MTSCDSGHHLYRISTKKNVSCESNCEKQSDKPEGGDFWPDLLKKQPACPREPPGTAAGFRDDIFSIAPYLHCPDYENELARK